MASANSCSECGAEISPAAQGSLCRRCLFALALNAGIEADSKTPVPPRDDVTGPTVHRIGRYKLLQKIGEGGCGVVYMAEQEEPIRRRVALKVIKLGMDTKNVIARFEAERQALALMDHPNIARVIDAGATEAGRPFFAMELVRGIKITDYCDQNNVSAEERLKLFIQVCQAVQHAHQKGIIHRDLKPSNILVTLHDGVPVPKVIDFGIAKATEGRLTDKTLFTQFHQFIGTPAYMSPEQAELSGLDIDTRSDIYSLGVLLYELLTSNTPFDSETLLRVGLDEMRRVIREEEPAKPSTRLRTLAAKELSVVASRRHCAPQALNKLVCGELDWIVMKALEKDRTRRYESASAFAQDIQRHLQHEPVSAAAPSPLYKFQKFALRNKGALATATAMAAVLLAGAIISTWLAVSATDAKKKANTEAMRAKRAEKTSQRIAQFLKEVLKEVGPSVALGRDTTLLRKVFDRTVERIGNELKDEPDVKAELRNTLGEVYLELGEFDRAETMVSEALALRKELLGNEHEKVAGSLDNLANVLKSQGKLAEAESRYREVLALRRKLLGNEHPDVAASLAGLANVHRSQGRLDEAETKYREALAMGRKLLGDEHLDVAKYLTGLAFVLHSQDKRAEAETMHREALAMRRKLLGNEHPDVALSLFGLGDVLWGLKNLAEAETTHREALAMRRKLLGNEHPDVARSLNSLAHVLQSQGKLPEAEKMWRDALAMGRKLLGNEHPDVAKYLSGLGSFLRGQGRLAEAEKMYREALAMRRKLLGDEHPDVARSLTNLASLLQKQGKLAEAEQIFTEYLTPAAQNQFRSAGLLRSRGNVRARTARWKEAAADLSKVVQLNPNNSSSWFQLAPLLIESGDLAGYRENCHAMLALFGTTTDPRVAEQTAKACLLVPITEEDLASASRMADIAVTADKDRGWLAYYEFAKGLAEYRQGRFALASEWAKKALAKAREDNHLAAQSYIVMAIAHHQLSHTNDARIALDKAVEIVKTKLPKIESGPLTDNWQDWLISQILLREAETLIPSASAVSVPAK
jgi:serine/threonine protein kinase/tetratricopeptide (TPR) repeat protein